MLFQSAIVSRGSGSIGGLTASHGKGGNYFRARTTPTDPNTPAQALVRVIFATLQSIWLNNISQSQRDDWAVYAANVPLLNPFGEPRTVTALNMFTRTNVPRLQAGTTLLLNAPVEFNLGEFTPFSVVFSEATGVSVAFEASDDWAQEADSHVFIYVSRPQNATINFFRSPYRLIGKIDGDDTLPPGSPEVFGTPPFSFTEDQKLFVRLTVSRADGRYSTSQRLAGLAVA